MKTFRIGPFYLGLLLIVAGTPAIQSQEGKIVISLVPHPNQTVRFQMSQEMDMDLLADGAEQTDQQASVPIKILGKSTFGFTQKTGALDDKGQMNAEVTYNQLSIERTMNGEPIPIDNPGERLIGKKITLIFDKESRIIDVRIPKDVDLPANDLKQMMAAMYGNLPSSPLAVGETARMPFSMALPIPTPGAESLQLDGWTTYKLISVTGQGEDRLAKIEESVEANLAKSIEADTANGKAKVKLDFKLNGGGSLKLNLDSGVLRSGQMQTTIEGRMAIVGDTPNVKPQSIELHGTTKMTSSGSN